jgi:protein-L-isoaspartate(D-aspartate) O-methyltransferase
MLREIDNEARLTRSFTGRYPLSQRVMEALRRVPRHEFVPEFEATRAYENAALPIDRGQTISQPFVVALMADLADVGADDRVLEVGAGCGYMAAVLAELAAHVYGIELEPELADAAARRLGRLGYGNATLRAGDGAGGWPEHAPFDAILVSCATPSIPAALVEQLAPGGRLVAPIDSGASFQELVRLEKDREGGIHQRSMLPVAFVPLRHSPDEFDF